MKRFLFLFLFIPLVSFSLYGYGGAQHDTISKASIASLKINGFFTLNQYLSNHFLPDGATSYKQKLIASAETADLVPLSDAEINTYSSYVSERKKSYNYKSMLTASAPGIIAKFNGYLPPAYQLAAGVIVSTAFPILATVGSTVGFAVIIVDPQLFVKGFKMASAEVDTALQSSKKAFHHTYAEGDPNYGVVYDLQIAPYAAETEYNMAKALWSTDKQTALYRLGRCLHYIQDMTVPHHSEIQGNWPDLMQGLTLSNITSGTVTTSSSQFKYETTEASNLSVDNNDNSFFRGAPISGKVKFSDVDYALNVKTRMKNIHNYVFNNNSLSRSMFMCDGIDRFDIKVCIDPPLPLPPICPPVSNQDMAKGKIYTLYMPHAGYSELKDPLSGYVIGKQYTGVGTNDNMTLVANDLIPYAVAQCAQVLAQFFYETEHIMKDNKIVRAVMPVLLN
jgi:hypothetical protein